MDNHSAPPPERSAYFHEDDYRMIELLPAEAWQFCITENQRIRKFADEHRTSGGFTDIYVGKSPPYPLADMEIARDAFAAALAAYFPAYDAVYTGYSSHREQCGNTLGWGNDACKIFMSHMGGIVQHVWLDFGPLYPGDEAPIMAALRALPQAAFLLLADWCWNTVAVIAAPGSLEYYFEQRTAD